MTAKRKVHLLRPNEYVAMCGKPRGPKTNDPSKVTCTGCRESYEANRTWYHNHTR